jgi:transcriptional regulator with XRE-family HTH domain
MMVAIVGSPEWIKGLRAELGLTQSQLAERLGVTYAVMAGAAAGVLAFGVLATLAVRRRRVR